MKQIRLIGILMMVGFISCNTNSRKTKETSESTSMTGTVTTKTNINKIEN